MVNFKLGETNVKMKINNHHVTSVGQRKNLSPWRDWTYDIPDTVWALYSLDLQRAHVEWGHILGSYFTRILHTSRITNEQVAGVPTKFSSVLFQNDVDIIVNADKARDILGCMIKLPWDVNKNLSSHIAAHLPLMQLPKFLTSEEQRRLPERYVELRDQLFCIFQYLYLIFIGG